MTALKAPFPYFGGKSRVAEKVWAALGRVDHYVEPFFGSGAVLLGRPHAPKVETVNDADGLLANFWRAVRTDPDAVAAHADWPTNEADLHARHLWLVGQRERLTERLMGDCDFYDAQAAGWWVWGLCNWIGGGWCGGEGPWIAVDGVMTDSRQLPHLGAGQCISRRRPHLGPGMGINRKLPHLGDAGRGAYIRDTFGALAERLRETRVACGDWTRVCGPAVLRTGGRVTGVFLDPPYDLALRTKAYALESGVAADCRQWCLDNGNQPGLRIVLAGYASEHAVLEDNGWRAVKWKTQGGYASREGRGRENAEKETLWFSPSCIGAASELFGCANHRAPPEQAS